MGRSGVLTPEEIESSGVKLDRGRENTTERLRVFGRIAGQGAYQSLSRDGLGNYHLATVITEEDGPTRTDVFTPKTKEEKERLLLNSLFQIEYVNTCDRRLMQSSTKV